MLAQHAVEGRKLFPNYLLKVLRRFVAALLQLFLYSRLLRRGRKIRAGIELVEKVVDLLHQHRRPAAVVLPPTSEFELQQRSLDSAELLPKLVCGFANRFRGVIAT